MSPALLFGAFGILAGAAGVVVGARRGHHMDGTSPGRRVHVGAERGHRPTLLAGAASGMALLTLVVTRWPVAALLAGTATLGVPVLLGSTTGGRGTHVVESIAAWTELLRDTLSAAAGLGQAIVATAELSPGPIRDAVVSLADRLANGVPTDSALRAFAADVDDPAADMVVCALLVAVSAQSQRLTELLGALADSCRDQVAMRLRVEASRASSRSSVRTVVVFSVAFATLLFVLAHTYLAPFGSATGQLVLGAVGACYAGGLLLMARLVRPRPGVRLLRGGERS